MIEFDRQQQEQFMRLAMKEVASSIAVGGNPFGAVLVSGDGEVLATARNTVTPDTDISQHAELNLLRLANEKLHRQKFPDCAVFINAASCSMCASALIQAGVRYFYVGAPFESHTNPAVSYEQLAPFCKEPIVVHSGILADECRSQITAGRQAMVGVEK